MNLNKSFSKSFFAFFLALYGSYQCMVLIHNHFHNILRLFDALQHFPFTASEPIGDYYLSTWYIRVALRAAERLKT